MNWNGWSFATVALFLAVLLLLWQPAIFDRLSGYALAVIETLEGFFVRGTP